MKKAKKGDFSPSKKQVILTVGLLFALGSVFGWIFEFFVRGFDEGFFYNPGFLRGTYLPIYGFGTVGLYAIGKLPLPIKNKWWKVAVKVVIAAVALTAIEYVGGWIFIKKLGFRLWDYSQAKGNVQGLICPLCSLVWGLLAAVYLLFLHAKIEQLERVVDKRAFVGLTLAFFYGAMVADCVFTLLG